MKIRLFCAAGMSTSLMVTKMRAAAKEMGIDADIEAAGETRMKEETDGIDVALLGPQIRYKLSAAKKLHDELESHYVGHMDFLKWQTALDRVLEELALE